MYKWYEKKILIEVDRFYSWIGQWCAGHLVLLHIPRIFRSHLILFFQRDNQFEFENLAYECVKQLLFVCGFSSYSIIFHSFIWRRHHCRWRAAKIDLYSALMAIAFPVTHQSYCDTSHPFIMVIFEDPWHSHLLPSVWQ